MTSLAALTLFSTPALAQTNAGFTGPRVELQTGLSDSNISDTDVTYGAVLGYDAPLSDRVTLGADIQATNAFDRNGRVLGAGARLGYAFNPHTLGYVRAGYANLDAGKHLNGAAIGGGLEFRLTKNAYLNTEYRYTNYNRGVHSNAGLLGVGIRF